MLKSLLRNKIFQNFSYLTAGSIVAQAISLFAILKITRLLAPDDYGVFTFLMMQGMLLLTIGDLGIRNILIRSIARDRERTNDLIVNGAILRVGAIIVLSLLYLVYNHYLGSLNTLQLIFVFAFTLVSCFANLFETVFMGNERMLVPSLVNIGYSVLWLSAVLILPAGNFAVTELFVIFLGLNLLRALIYFQLLRHQDLLVGRILNFWVSSKKLLSESWPYFLVVLIMLPFTKLSNNFLDINSTLDEVGYFNLSQKLVGPVSMVMEFALAAIFPNLSALWIKDKERFRQFVTRGLTFFMLASLLVCFLFTLFAREVVLLLFPVEYLPAVAVCQLQIWYLFLTSLDSLVGTIFGATNREKLILRVGIVNTLIGAPLLYYGSMYGALGLAYGYVIAFAVIQFYLWYLFRKSLGIRMMRGPLLWLLSLALFLVSYLFPADAAIGYRILLAGSVLGAVGLYLFRNYQKVLAR